MADAASALGQWIYTVASEAATGPPASPNNDPLVKKIHHQLGFQDSIPSVKNHEGEDKISVGTVGELKQVKWPDGAVISKAENNLGLPLMKNQGGEEKRHEQDVVSKMKAGTCQHSPGITVALTLPIYKPISPRLAYSLLASSEFETQLC
jgi:hypothetical protein